MASSEVGKDTKMKQCQRCLKLYPEGTGWLCPEDNGELVPYGPDPLIGTLFDNKYEIQSVLGQGGMSIVYKAHHKYMDRIVAVKLLREHLVTDQNARARFEQESKAASALSHQNIVAVHDFGFTANGQAYFVMDCLEGESLADMLDREARLPLSECLPIFKQICDGLEPAHKLGMIHRDLKPSNIVLNPQENGEKVVKIVDFGIAKFMPREGMTSSPRLTQTGEVFGSPIYMSPEQCQGHTLDPRSDIYSLGCLMYETLAGVPPFFGDSFLNIAMQHMSATPPSFKDAAAEANIPAAVEEVVMKCLLKEPENRFQTVAEVRQALLDAALFSGVKGVRPGAVPTPNPHSPFKNTFERFRISLKNTAAQPAVKTGLSLAKLSLIALPATCVIALVVWGCMWPGPKGDRGLGVDKLHWQLDMMLAQQAADSGNYEQARDKLLDAKSVTARFGDNYNRLRLTLDQLVGVYGKLERYRDQEQTNNELDDVIKKQMLNDVEETKDILAQLKKTAAGGGKVGGDAALANQKRIVYASRRLHARAMYHQEEALLREAINTFNSFELTTRTPIATFDTELANNLIAQQRLTEVEPVLEDALSIRLEAAKGKPPGSEQQRELINIYLKLGQFDRDQSNFPDSHKELSEALRLTEQHFGKDSTLMAVALNSYADLLRQMGDKAEFARVAAEAKKYNQKLTGGNVGNAGTTDTTTPGPDASP